MNRIARTLLCAITAIPMYGCANMQASKAPGADPSTLKTFYVHRLSADERGLERIIPERLNSLGYQSTYGNEPSPANPVDAIVTDQDR